MALFRRKKDDSVLPEVDKYYEGERRDRPVMAWLLALASIALVALVIVGLFLAGRWAYNEITQDDEPAAPTTGEVAEAPTFDGTPEATDQESTEEPTDSDSSSTNDNGSTPAPEQSQPAPQAPATTQSNSDLPHTGPEGVAVAFVTTSVAAGTAHHLLQRRKARV